MDISRSPGLILKVLTGGVTISLPSTSSRAQGFTLMSSVASTGGLVLRGPRSLPLDTIVKETFVGSAVFADFCAPAT